jgi:hypothetical protein
MGIVVEVVNRSGYVLHCQVLEKDHVTVGRAYTNDIVIADDYIDPVHVSIQRKAHSDLQEECNEGKSEYEGEHQHKFICSDHSSINGVLDSKGRKRSTQSILFSGQVIGLGKTLLRISSSTVVMPPAIRLSAWEQLSDTLTQKWVVILASILCLLLTLVDTYLSTFVVKDKMAEYAAVLYLFLVLAIYAGIFAVLGKALRQDSRFWPYYTLITGAMAMVIIYDLLSPWVFFNFNIHIGEAVDSILYALIVAIVLYFSLRFSSSLRTLSRAVIAAIIPCLVIVNLVLNMTKSDDFTPLPAYDVTAYRQSLYFGFEESKTNALTSAQELYTRALDNDLVSSEKSTIEQNPEILGTE